MAHPAFARTDHRPWPLPSGPWLGRQTWLDLAFIHFPVPAAELQRFVPKGLQLQEHDGTSWVGIVPFYMKNVMVRGLPSLPWLSAFPELNVRLYVEHEGIPGVWFLSLDATNPVAVWAARRFFHLPYRRANMFVRTRQSTIEYASEVSGTRFSARYEPLSGPYEAQPKSLEHWLTERYCLYAQAPNGTLLRCDVHHVPWPLQAARVDILENTLLRGHGIRVPPGAPLMHFARRLDVVVWAPRPVARTTKPLRQG